MTEELGPDKASLLGTTPQEASYARMKSEMRVMTRAYKQVLESLDVIRQKIEVFDKITRIHEQELTTIMNIIGDRAFKKKS